MILCEALFLTLSERICPSAVQATAIAVPGEIPEELLLLTTQHRADTSGKVVTITIYLSCNSLAASFDKEVQLPYPCSDLHLEETFHS